MPPKGPRPTDQMKLKQWVRTGWPKEPARQQAEYDAGMAAINAAQKNRQAQADWEAMKAANTRKARGKR